MKLYSKFSLLLMLVMFTSILAFYPGHAQTISPTGERPWDLRYANQEGLFVFYDTPAAASSTGKPIDIGDLDGNDCGDLVITGQNATFNPGDNWRNQAGHVRIVMNVCEVDGRIALEEEAQPSHTVVTVLGAYTGDMVGIESYTGDFNGDGYDDILVGAQNNDGPSQEILNAGSAYVILGGIDFAQQDTIDLRIPPANVLTFYGADEADRFGIWVEGGDFDGDGLHDLLIGANQADGEDDRRFNAGEAWIIYGEVDLIASYGQVIDMETPPESATRIIGVDYDDLLGSTVSGDDLNGDGIDDAIVAAAIWRGSAGIEGLSFGGGDGPDNRRYNSGDTFVIFGEADLRSKVIDLAALVDDDGAPLDTSITVIYGVDENDALGEEIAAGDLDGDGTNDLVLGSLIADGIDNRQVDAGEAWVIYTHEPFAGQSFDLRLVRPDRAIVIYPDQEDSKGGDTLRVADLNSDGVGDLFYGAPDYDPIGYDLTQRRNAGMLAVLFSQEGGLAHQEGQVTVPSNMPSDMVVRYVVGADPNDMMAYAMAVYDVDNDGIVDIAPNGMGGDGANNTFRDAGEIYILSGAEFLSDDHNYTPEVTVSTQMPNLTPSPMATVSFDLSVPGDTALGEQYYQQACAGCHGIEGNGEGVGVPLMRSPFVLNASDEELLSFLRLGRPSDHPDNITGVTMPAYGGRADWGDDEMWHIIAYLRSLIVDDQELAESSP